MIDVLKVYLKKLTNLSGNNKSLLQLRLFSGQDIDLHDIDFLNDAPSFEIINALINRKSKISLCDILDSRNESINAFSKKLKNIHRRTKFIEEERGAKDLYVGWPFVRGKFSDGTAVRCPLLFFPVSIDHDEKRWYLKPQKDVNITFNKSFLLAYAHFNQKRLKDDFIDIAFDELNTDSQIFRTELYSILKDGPIEINFNQDNFNNKLQHFETFSKATFDNENGIGELKLFPEAILGVYPQAGSYLVPDYHHLLENPPHEDLEAFFMSKIGASLDYGSLAAGGQTNFVGQIKEEHTFTPYKTDASQENAIKAVKKGYSLVVQGPPGTGKSQLICNLASDFIARGKRVLIVCQKRAALDVVYNRLKEKDIADFAALVHDFKNDRKLIYDKIASQIDRINEYQQRNNALDTIHLERSHLQASRKIDQLTEELEDFRNALFSDKDCGISIKELYLTSNPENPFVNLKQEFNLFDLDRINEFSSLLERYLPYYEQLEQKPHPWKERKTFKNWGITDQKEIETVLDEIEPYQEKFIAKQASLLGNGFSIDESDWILDREQQILDMLDLVKPTKIFGYFKHVLKKKVDVDWLLLKEKRISECFHEPGIESVLTAEELGPFQEALQKCLKARKRLYKWVLWKLFSKDKYKIKRVIVGNDLDWTKKGFKKLKQKIDNRLNLEHNLTSLKTKDWLTDFPPGNDRRAIESWFNDYTVAMEAKLVSEELRSFRDYLKIDLSDYKSLNTRMTAVLKECHLAKETRMRWETYLSHGQVSHILEDYKFVKALKHSLKNDFDSLCEFDKIKAAILPSETPVLNKVLEYDLKSSEKEIVALFQNSIRLAWIDHLETKYPILRAVSSKKMEQMENELQQQIKQKMGVSKDILILKAREKTYDDVEYNRLNNMVTYRDLHHQATKKRKIWPIRKTINAHHDEIFKLLPCWLTSPESVSAIFPMEQLFDLVIFDEASQCFAEKGIPAIYRGSQVVVTGDEKQLSPNDLYQIRYEGEEEDDSPVLAIDSLLDLTNKYLLEIQLEGHYRSESLDLIDFSNRHFYQNKLRLLPHFTDINTREPGIRYTHVKGIWDNGHNEIEAIAVVDEALKLLENGEKGIGIVTFNYKQQHHIQDLLEQKSIEKSVLIPESLFVKNIENVQGDERDIIIFSIGYAPNAKGKLTMQFGSLNSEKGENRLNVAITRAREKVIVVSSILPQQLVVEDTKHEGPKLFKKYLEYAFEVSNGDYIPSPSIPNGFRSAWYLKNQLPGLISDNKTNFEFNQELPFADLTVKENSNYTSLILTDDDLYYQSISAKDVHAYVPLGLKQKKWKFKRFYSRGIWANREKETNELQRFLSK